MPPEKVRAHLTISGRVQGVCYRMYMEQEATRLGITGSVRNLPTGQVEAVCEGTKEAVEKIIRWCHTGPPAARVREVSVSWETFQGIDSDFRTV